MQNSWEGEARSYATDMYVVRKRGKVGEPNQKSPWAECLSGTQLKRPSKELPLAAGQLLDIIYYDAGINDA